MYYIGIDVSKYKHDCFIMNEHGVVIRDSFSFDNNKEGFKLFLDVVKSLDCSQEIKIGLEATGHYGDNLKLIRERTSRHTETIEMPWGEDRFINNNYTTCVAA